MKTIDELLQGFDLHGAANTRIAECKEFLGKLPDDRRAKLEETLLRCLENLLRIGENYKSRPRLCYDFAPLSFGVVVGSLGGGMIFHGNHDGGGDGGAPTFSVCLSPVDGWSLHT